MNRIEARIRCTTHVWTTVFGQVASIACGKPVSPSQQAISTSATPRLRSSASTPAQNLAPSEVCTQIPSTCLIPSQSTPTARWGGLVADLMVVTDLHHQRVQVQDRIDRLQRPGLPGFDLLGDRVGDVGDRLVAQLG